MLDLGVWMAFQSLVEKLHLQKRQESKALCNTVDQAWEDMDAIKLRNVYERWKLVPFVQSSDKGLPWGGIPLKKVLNFEINLKNV